MTELEETLWNTMLNSEMNALYYGYIARRYERKEKFFQIIAAILAISAISSLQLWRMQITWFEWSRFWDIVSIIALIISVFLPIINFNKIANNASELRPVFQMFTNEYEDLWLQRHCLEESSLREKFSALKRDETLQTKFEANMPRDVKLLGKCQDQIIKGRGLQ